jgi:hypothetical protein
MPNEETEEVEVEVSNEEEPLPTSATPPRIDGAVDNASGGAPASVVAALPPSRHPYSIAAGKALTSPRGVLEPGDEIRPTDVSGGVEQLEYLVRKGYVVKAAS